jgi:transcriptional regulator of acetoin/glycerol metabolism
MQERLARQVFLEKRTFSPAEERIVRQNQLIAKAIEQRVADLTSNPEVFDLMRWRTLREYQTGLKKDRFAETPSREKLIKQVRQMWAEGRKLLATGATGTGKTELFKHASQSIVWS